MKTAMYSRRHVADLAEKVLANYQFGDMNEYELKVLVPAAMDDQSMPAPSDIALEAYYKKLLEIQDRQKERKRRESQLSLSVPKDEEEPEWITISNLTGFRNFEG